VKGIDEKISYSRDDIIVNNNLRRFGRYYFLAQDVYHTQGYYNRYKVYNIEASLYNLKSNNKKSLVWMATYELVNPREINKTISNYVSAILKSMETHNLVRKP